MSEPSGHTYLDFNAPLSDERAARLVASLQPLAGARVLDLGCGWAELLLRIVGSDGTATGVGIDADAEAIARGRANAKGRGLDARVRLDVGDVTAFDGVADIVVSIGASHAWGGHGAGTEAALAAARRATLPGGRVLFGDGVWQRPPSGAALLALDAGEDEFADVAGLVDIALGAGFRLLQLSEASLDEWDAFESRWCAGRERWLLDHPADPRAAEERRVVDAHRDAWLRGYRGYLGFAYLTLGVPG